MNRALVFLVLFPITLPAEELFITNPGFEDISGESAYNEFTFGPLPGWSLYDSGNPLPITDGGDGPTYYIGTLRPTERDPVGNPGVYENFPDGALEGIRVGIAFNYSFAGNGGEYGFFQQLGATLQGDTTYTLQVLVGNITSGYAVDSTYFDLRGFPGYRIDLMAGGAVLASDANTLAGAIPDGTFGLSTVSFTTTSNPDHLGEFLGIRLVNLNVVDPAFPGADLEVDFDDVRLTAEAVPEPAAGLLVLAGLGAFWAAGPGGRRRH